MASRLDLSGNSEDIIYRHYMYITQEAIQKSGEKIKSREDMLNGCYTSFGFQSIWRE